MIAILLPAAGQSRRMQRADKLLELVDGEAALRRAARCALMSGIGPVIVTLRPNDTARADTLAGLDVAQLTIANADDGMSASLAAGSRAAMDLPGPRSPDALMVMLPDMPDILPNDLIRIAQAFEANPDSVIRVTTEAGQPGHPVLFPSRLLDDFKTLTGDRGAAAVLKGENVVSVPLPGDRAILDLDTPEDWKNWRARR